MQVYIFGLILVAIVISILCMLSKVRCLRKQVNSYYESLWKSMIWSGVIFTVQLSYMSMCLIAFASFTDESSSPIQGYVLFALLLAYALGIAYLIRSNRLRLRSIEFK